MPTNDTLQTQIDFLDNLSQINRDVPMKYVLRDYQVQAVDAGVRHLQSNRKPGIIVAPTGSGKSLVIANIAIRLNGHVLNIVPSKELLEQNYAKLMSYNTGVEVGIFSASMNEKTIKKITFCTIGSVVNKPSLFQHFQYIIVDECHVVSNESHMMYNKFITALGNKPLMGLTATPWRLGRNSYGNILRVLCRQKPRIFTDIIHHTQIKTLQDQGYLAECKYYQVNNGFDSSKIKLNSTGMDYLDSSLKSYYKSVSFDNSILDICKRLINAGRENILVFVKFVEDAHLLVRDLGDISAVVWGDMPKDEREQTLADFKSGKIRIVVNVGVLLLGYDFPALETVVIGKPSRSATFWYQAIGRCVRPYMTKVSWVVDICDNLNNRFPPIDRFWLAKDNTNNWAFFNKDNNRQITNIYFQ